MRPPRHPGDLETLDRDECLSLLASVPVGRVGFLHDNRLELLPVNHLVLDHKIVFRCAPGTKLGAAAAGLELIIEGDQWDPATHEGWSVVARGTGRIVTDADELETLHAVDFAPWTGPDVRPFWIAIDASEITGRRVSD